VILLKKGHLIPYLVLFLLCILLFNTLNDQEKMEVDAIMYAEKNEKIGRWISEHHRINKPSIASRNHYKSSAQLFSKEVISENNNWSVTYTTNAGVHPYALKVTIDKKSGKISSISEQERVIILFKDDVKEGIIEDSGGEIINSSKEVPVASAQVPLEDLNSLVNDPNIVTVEEDQIIGIHAQTLDWGVPHVKAPNAWKSNITGNGVKISVIDTGISKDHPDLHISGGISFVSYTNDFQDDNGHGTHVAGIIGAKNNNTGMVGVAPDSSLYAVKSLDSNGDGYLSDIIAGIDWSINNGMDIINLSVGAEEPSLALEAAVDKAYSKGIFVVASAGNSGGNTNLDTINYPAKYDSAIAVGAVDMSNNIAEFSSTGPSLEVVAPGKGINSTYLNNSFARISGTSMSAPFVSGLIALYKELLPDMPYKDLREMLQKKVIDLGNSGRDSIYGFGVVQYSEKINNVLRVSGQNRFEVAANIANRGWPETSETIILANYLAFADALSASPLAFRENAPILLTQKEKLPEVTKEQILRLKPKNVIIVGGPGSISESVIAHLQMLDIINIKRINGKDRFEVSTNIAKELGNPAKVIIVNGHIFADALSIAPYAARMGYPILLVNNASIPKNIGNYIKQKNLQGTIIVGGAGSISSNIFDQLPSPTRIGGKDRYEVAANIARELIFPTQSAYIATGLSFSDALTGSVLAAKEQAPLLLSKTNTLPSPVKTIIEEKNYTDYMVLGEPASVSDSVYLKLKFGT
jgi:minor extracellular protease Epr